jgi:endonuclease/exonuclease/phosphatase family metal-dependent hydrolase
VDKIAREQFGSRVARSPRSAPAHTAPVRSHDPAILRDMIRVPEFAAECRALVAELTRYRTLIELRSAPDWPALEARLVRVLSTMRRYEPSSPPTESDDPSTVRAVHWNIEHGNWYDQIERALLTHPQLKNADLLMFNEIDFGMARAGNRDVTDDLATALGRHAVWAPLFLETTEGRDDDPTTAKGRANEEALFGLAILSRWPIGEARILPLPSPESLQFDLERMYGRHIALVAEIERPGAPFIAVSVHLEVHRTREHRAAQMRLLMKDLKNETRPVILAGDFNSHTFDRGRWWDPFFAAAVLLSYPTHAIQKRLLYPDEGHARETLFDPIRDANFEWRRHVDHVPTLQIRFDRLDEAKPLLRMLGPLSKPLLGWAEARGSLRLDWFTGRGWRDGRGATVKGLNGPGLASDHAPLVATFRS